MELLVDIGNTNLKWAIQHAGRLSRGGALPHGRKIPAEVGALWLGSSPPGAVWVANVAGARLAEKLTDWTRQHWALTPHFAQSQPSLLGVTNGYRDPRRLGVDRWLAMVATYHARARAVLVVDCGTAATLDLVAADGRHLGGLILPGFGMMHSALLTGTRLALPPAEAEPPWLGSDTSACVAAGTREALLGAIERTLRQAREMLAATPDLMLTGGDGAKIAEHLTARFEPDLVLQGLGLYARLG
jgi:type III pantothenate kinase